MAHRSENLTPFGQAFWALVESRFRTHAAFLRKAGLKNPTVHRWCTSDILPRHDQIERAARALGVDASEIWKLRVGALDRDAARPDNSAQELERLRAENRALREVIELLARAGK